MLHKCIKQTVVATIITKCGETISGFNGIKNLEITECPRVVANIATGVGYELCKDVCNQVGHAEIEAIKNSKGYDLTGATMYLTGHTYCCDNCLEAIKNSGISKVYVVSKEYIL